MLFNYVTLEVLATLQMDTIFMHFHTGGSLYYTSFPIYDLLPTISLKSFGAK